MPAWSVIAPYWPNLLSGFWITVQLSFWTLLLATPIALAIALARETGPRWAALPLAILVNAVRLLPALIVLYFVFYGMPQFGIRLKPFAAASIGLVAMGAAYMSEDMRGAIAAVPKGQLSAAAALGLPRTHAIRRILLPQALPLMIPPYMTRAIIMVKGTSLASMVSVADLTAEATRASSITYQPYVFLLIAGGFYLALNGILALIQALAERHLRLSRRTAAA
ncbi:amino acid ABC transporter permease [Mangrovicoccus sp. HB161399]|uniref:amino acid ABC transporter permease n=1 Tax=Mangrovicoccus sp. HB161399 TaxID=2720392 RepID=UPI00155331D4|nr:amino acid ABC transporter permease [Mangrovicoccus sp. HB161399]